MSEPPAIFVGRKSVMNYVLAALLQFDSGAEQIVLKARGKAISKAVDVAEIIKRRLLEDKVEVKDVKIGTELVGEGENARNVSIIEIVLGKRGE
jgi:DNA-binding protein